ncbi:tetratricopeptide repeat protein [Vicingaceae bacterium]|nr:tetratricopeptide repeat protein [Vicingaceae bacterium]
MEKNGFLFLGVLIFIFVQSCDVENTNLIESPEGERIVEDDYFQVYYGSGYTKIKGGFFADAIKDFDKAYAINPKDPHLNYGIGFAHSAIQKDSAAIYFYSLAISEKKDHSGAYFSRGVSYHLLGKDSLAILDYNESAKFNPSFRDVYFNRANSYLVLNNKRMACIDLNKGHLLGDQNCTNILQKYCEIAY